MPRKKGSKDLKPRTRRSLGRGASESKVVRVPNKLLAIVKFLISRNKGK